MSNRTLSPLAKELLLRRQIAKGDKSFKRAVTLYAIKKAAKEPKP